MLHFSARKSKPISWLVTAGNDNLLYRLQFFSPIVFMLHVKVSDRCLKNHVCWLKSATFVSFTVERYVDHLQCRKSRCKQLSCKNENSAVIITQAFFIFRFPSRSLLLDVSSVFTAKAEVVDESG